MLELTRRHTAVLQQRMGGRGIDLAVLVGEVTDEMARACETTPA